MFKYPLKRVTLWNQKLWCGTLFLHKIRWNEQFLKHSIKQCRLPVLGKINLFRLGRREVLLPPPPPSGNAPADKRLRQPITNFLHFNCKILNILSWIETELFFSGRFSKDDSFVIINYTYTSFMKPVYYSACCAIETRPDQWTVTELRKRFITLLLDRSI